MLYLALFAGGKGWGSMEGWFWRVGAGVARGIGVGIRYELIECVGIWRDCCLELGVLKRLLHCELGSCLGLYLLLLGLGLFWLDWGLWGLRLSFGLSLCRIYPLSTLNIIKQWSTTFLVVNRPNTKPRWARLTKIQALLRRKRGLTWTLLQPIDDRLGQSNLDAYIGLG